MYKKSFNKINIYLLLIIFIKIFSVGGNTYAHRPWRCVGWDRWSSFPEGNTGTHE